jgi:hypothetical protein
MLILKVRVPESLAEAASKRAGLPPNAPRAALVRKCLAMAAGWPDEAVEAVVLLRSTSRTGRPSRTGRVA